MLRYSEWCRCKLVKTWLDQCSMVEGVSKHAELGKERTALVAARAMTYKIALSVLEEVAHRTPHNHCPPVLAFRLCTPRCFLVLQALPFTSGSFLVFEKANTSLDPSLFPHDIFWSTEPYH